MSSPRARDRAGASPLPAAICTRMPSHFHSAENSSRSSAAQSLVLQRVRQHQRPEHQRVATSGFGGASLEPGEQRLVGRRERRARPPRSRRPRARHLGHGGLGQPGRDADAQARRSAASAAPSARSRRARRASLQPRPQIVAADECQLGDDVGQARGALSPIGRRGEARLGTRGIAVVAIWAPTAAPRRRGRGRALGSRIPHQRDRLGRIADVVARQAEQLGVDARPSCRRACARSGKENGRPSVRAASAQPRSGSGVARK